MKHAKDIFFANFSVFLYIFLILLNISAIWILPYLPTQDGPNHVYNLTILKDLLNGGKIWGNYYNSNLRAVPNLGFIAISYPLTHFFEPFIVEKIFVSIYILFFAISVPIYIQTFSPSNLPLSFVVFPLIFNFCLMMGFYSYMIALPCLLLAISFSWSTRNKNLFFKIVSLNLIGIIIFYLHLIPFVIFIISLTIIAIANSRNFRSMFKDTAFNILMISPMVILLSNYLYNIKSLTHVSTSNTFSIMYPIKLILDLLTFSSYGFSPWQILPSAILLLTLYPAIKTKFIKYQKVSILQPEQRFNFIFSITLASIYLTLPFAFGGGSYFNQRLTVIIIIVLISFLKIPVVGFYRKYLHVMLFGIAIISLSTNFIVFKSQVLSLQEFLSGLKTTIPSGSIIALFRPINSESEPVDPLQHATAYYALKNNCIDAGNYAADMPYFQVQFKDTLPPLPDWTQLENTPEKIDWKTYPDVRYLLAWKLEKNDLLRLKTNFRRLVATENFYLLERK